MSTLTYENGGRYRGKITNWGLSPSSGKGTPQFWVSFIPIYQINPMDPEDTKTCPSEERTIFRPITEGTIDYVAQDLEKLGYDRADFDGLDPNSSAAFSFKDTEFDAVCRHDTYEGKTREKWEFAFGGGLQLTPLATNEVKKLNALFGKRLKGKPGNGRHSQSGTTSTEPEPSSEPVPF